MSDREISLVSSVAIAFLVGILVLDRCDRYGRMATRIGYYLAWALVGYGWLVGMWLLGGSPAIFL